MASTGLSTATAADLRYGSQIHPDVRGLLDHVALELAEEYARLMEAAAAAEKPHHEPDDGHEEDESR